MRRYAYRHCGIFCIVPCAPRAFYAPRDAFLAFITILLLYSQPQPAFSPPHSLLLVDGGWWIGMTDAHRLALSMAALTRTCRLLRALLLRCARVTMLAWRSVAAWRALAGAGVACMPQHFAAQRRRGGRRLLPAILVWFWRLFTTLLACLPPFQTPLRAFYTTYLCACRMFTIVPPRHPSSTAYAA